ncbi:hypothetical protein V3C99_012697 [Haemonchus contortus]
MELLDSLELVEKYATASVQRTFRDRTRPYDYLSDVEFRKDYRFTRPVFNNICQLVQDDLQQQQGRAIDLSVADQVSISIHLLGRNVIQSDAARIAGCNQTTVGDASFGFVRASNRKAGRFIFWPRAEEKIEIKRKFYTKFGIPSVTGVIDGTQCRIQRPTEGKEDYVNRAGYHSIDVGVVVDSDMRISWVNSK